MDSVEYIAGLLFVLGVVILLICCLFDKCQQDDEFFYFDCPPPPGTSDAEVREFRRWQKEQRINREFPKED